MSRTIRPGSRQSPLPPRRPRHRPPRSRNPLRSTSRPGNPCLPVGAPTGLPRPLPPSSARPRCNRAVQRHRLGRLSRSPARPRRWTCWSRRGRCCRQPLTRTWTSPGRVLRRRPWTSRRSIPPSGPPKPPRTRTTLRRPRRHAAGLVRVDRPARGRLGSRGHPARRRPGAAVSARSPGQPPPTLRSTPRRPSQHLLRHRRRRDGFWCRAGSVQPGTLMRHLDAPPSGRWSW